MRELIVASRNKGKVAEIKELLDDLKQFGIKELVRSGRIAIAK